MHAPQNIHELESDIDRGEAILQQAHDDVAFVFSAGDVQSVLQFASCLLGEVASEDRDDAFNHGMRTLMNAYPTFTDACSQWIKRSWTN